MSAPKTPAADRRCAACPGQAVEWVEVLPGTDRPWRALCASCKELAGRSGMTAVEAGPRTWWWL